MKHPATPATLLNRLRGVPPAPPPRAADVIRPPLFLLVLAWTALARPLAAAGAELSSPDGRLVVTFEVKDVGVEKACPVYRLAYAGKEVLRDSRLGLDL